MSVRQPLVSDPRNIGHYRTMDTIMEELSSDNEKVVRRAKANYETCLSRIGEFANDSTVCRRFIDLTFEQFPDDCESLTSKLMDYVDKDDTSVLLYLTERLIASGDTATASMVFGSLTPGQDLALKEYVLGRFSYIAGDMDEAKQHFIKAILTNPTLYPATEFLHAIDTRFGWLHIANIMRVINGELPITYDSIIGGEMEELYTICEQWSTGDWNGAIAAIRRLPSFDEGDPFTLSMYAKMSTRSGNYREALEAYSRALDVLKDSEYISLGLAEAYDAIGDYESSAALLERVEGFNPHSPRILVTKYVSLLNDGRRQDAEHTLETLMGSADLDAVDLERCIGALRYNGMNIEATNLTRRVSARCIDRAYGEFLLASDDLANRNYRSAISHANSALRMEKSFIRARCLRVKAYLETDGVTKAMQDVNRMLDEDSNDINVLDVKKDIHIAIGQYEEALGICDLMIRIDPRNADVMKDRAIVLGLMGDHKGSLDSYREALNIRGDVRLFISIITELLRQRRVQDLRHLVDDFDDVFGRSTLVWRLRGNAEYVAGMYEEAATSYERAAELSPNEGDIWHSKGLAEEAAKMYREAEDSFGRALLVDLDNTEYWISKAVIQEKRGNFRGAIASLNKVISSSDNGVFPLTMKARLLVRCGRVRESIYFLDQAQRIDPNNLGIMRLSKDVFMHLGEYEMVIRLCRKINSITGGDYNATMDLIFAYIVADDQTSATSLLDQISMNHDLSLEVLLKCAQAYHKIGDFDNEATMLERALELSPDDRGILADLAEAYVVSGNRVLASSIYERLRDVDPGDKGIAVRKVILDVVPDVVLDEPVPSLAEDHMDLMDIARRTLDSGMADEAIQIYHKVIEDDPDCIEAYLAILDIMMDRGDIVDAIAMASESVHVFPNDSRILKMMGDVYVRADDCRKAVDAYTDAMKLGMETAELHASLGLALESIGMNRMALDNYRLASEKCPQNTEYRLNIAELEAKVGHDDAAESVLGSILAIDPHNVRALRLYVSICCRKNDSEAVLALFDDILSAVDDDDDVRFFESSLRELGEDVKADRIAAKLTS